MSVRPLHTDEELLVLLGNPAKREEGFRLLVERYQSPLYQHIRRILPDHEDTNDALQNTFVNAFRFIDRFRGDAKLYTWLYRIATNEALGARARIQRLRTTALDEPATRHEASGQMPFDGSEEAIAAILSAAVATLPERQQLVFNMRYFQELNYRDMAAILEVSEGALKASFHHAVRKVETF